MIQKKICMLGAFAVGKTSLVRRFVKSIFDDRYLTSLGVKIDKKVVEVDGQEVMLLLWDLEGEDDFHTLSTSYLRGTSGYFLVVDGTRKETLGVALDIHKRIREQMGDLPFYLLANKSDLESVWEIGKDELDSVRAQGIPVRLTSAKLGSGVEESFAELAASLIADS
ncbi:MAG: GTP-binding protein [Desulfovibrionaceae bacterium]|nr:GTP-binding protein [Desulfovibrionaceae bacterium]